MKIVPVILSGGAGTRLWPESRKAFPKPFMHMPDGETLLEKTLARAEMLADGGPIVTVTNQDYRQLTGDAYKRAGTGGNRHVFLLEPKARNTAPAIAMAAAWAQSDLGDEVCLVVLPSDHLIEDLERFQAAAGKAAELAAAGHLVTFGIKPTRPETGYGYIKSADPLLSGFQVDRFVEKPDLETAERYLASGNYLWNSGMFCFSPGAFLDAAEKVAPALAAGARECLGETDLSSDAITFAAESFGKLESISVDYAIFEKAPNVAVVAGDFDWNDVGSWQAISDLAASEGNYAEGDALFVDSQDVYVRNADRLVAVVGLTDLVVVDTPDALLISDRHSTQQVKQVVEQLSRAGSDLVRQPRERDLPWGTLIKLWDHNGKAGFCATIAPGSALEVEDLWPACRASVLEGQVSESGAVLEEGASFLLSKPVRNQTAAPAVLLVVKNRAQ